MVWIQQLGIYIGKSRKTGEDKSHASQFLQWIIRGQFQFQQLFEFRFADVHSLGGRFLLILHSSKGLARIISWSTARYISLFSQQRQWLDLRCPEVLVPLQVDLIFPSEFFGDIRKGNIRLTFQSPRTHGYSSGNTENSCRSKWSRFPWNGRQGVLFLSPFGADG